MVYGQMVNIAALLFMLVEITVNASTFYTKINVSLFLLEYIEPIGNTLLIC